MFCKEFCDIFSSLNRFQNLHVEEKEEKQADRLDTQTFLFFKELK